MSPPRVTVLASVHNDARYVEAAILSVLAQTYTDFELLVINDGSTDDSGERIDALAARDPRMRVVHQENTGLTRALNRGLDLARGEYIARQDSDDLSRPERLARQVAFLDAHPEHWVVGSRYQKVGPNGENLGRGRPPRGDLRIRLHLMLKGNALAHSSVVFRRGPILELGGYNEELPVAQDYDLWCRVALRARLDNLPAVLLERREHPGQIGKRRGAEQQKARQAIRRNYRDALCRSQQSEGAHPVARLVARTAAAFVR